MVGAESQLPSLPAPLPTSPLETELKCQVPPDRRAALRRAVATATAQTTRLQAVYADTPDHRLAAAGLALRLRKEGLVWVQTLKGRGDGLMARLEHEVLLPPQRGTPALDPARHAGTVVGQRLLQLLADGTPLQQRYRTDMQRLLRVHLPAYAVPAAAGLMIVFALAIGDYATAERLGIDTLSVGVHNLWLASQSSAVAATVSVVMIVPSVALVAVAAWASTRVVIQNPVAPALAAASRKPMPRPAAWVLLAWSVLCSLPGFWIPEVITLRWAWRLWDRTRFAAIPGDMLNAAGTSLCTALLVAAVCALTALLLRSGGRSSLAERVPWLFLSNYFLPSLVLALAFVVMSRDGSLGAQWLGPMRDSRLLIVLSEALRFLPFAMLPVLDALHRTPQATIEAARVFGMGPVRARITAFAGHLWPALLLGCALVFMESLKELDMSLMLQPFGYSSPALKIYAFSRHQNMDRAAVWVLITQALLLLPLLLCGWRVSQLGGGRPGNSHRQAGAA